MERAIFSSDSNSKFAKAKSEKKKELSVRLLDGFGHSDSDCDSETSIGVHMMTSSGGLVPSSPFADSVAPSPFRSTTASPLFFPVHGFENMHGNIIQKYAGKYLSYDDLDQLLNLMSQQPKYAITGSSKFYRLLETSYVKCKNFIDNWVQRLEISLGARLRLNAEAPDTAIDTATATDTDTDPDRLAEVLDLNQFVCVNSSALKKLIVKHDRQRSRKKDKILLSWRWRMDFQVWHKVQRMLAAVVSLKRERGGGAKAQPPQAWAEGSGQAVFGRTEAREVTKYWVRPQDLEAVALQLARSLEVYVPEEIRAVAEEGGRAPPPASQVSTVYMDNAARSCFHGRLQGGVGTKSLRVRSYNHAEKVWIERKVYHSRWGSGADKAAVERFSVCRSDALPLLRSGGPAVEGEREGVGPPAPDAFPQYAGIAMVSEAQRLVFAGELFPALRTECQRLCFQERESGPGLDSFVRVTLDTDVQLYQSKVKPSKTCFHQWYGECCDILNEDQITLPHSLLEVQISPGALPPAFLQRLLEGGLVHPCPGFSKFIHATYAFGVRVGRGGGGEKEDEYQDQGPSEDPGEDQGEGEGEGEDEFAAAKPQWWSGMGLPVEEVVGYNRKVSKRAIQHNQLHWFSRLMGIQGTEATGKKGQIVAVDLKSFFGNERTFLNWFHSAVITFTIGVGVATSGYFLVGGFLMAVGSVVGLYADSVYVWRFRLLMHRSTAREDSDYFDRFGPLLVTVIVLSAFAVAWLLSS